MYNGTAYIFTSGEQFEDGFTWYLDYYKTIDEAISNCPDGYSVIRYCEFEWRKYPLKSY